MILIKDPMTIGLVAVISCASTPLYVAVNITKSLYAFELKLNKSIREMLQDEQGSRYRKICRSPK